MHIPPTLELDWLRAFVTVADVHSFTDAAEVLASTQSAISVRMRKLEERLGQRLLERNARSVMLTPAGRALLPDARRIIDLHDDLSALARGTNNRATFELGISDHAAGRLLPALLAPLRAQFENHRIGITVGSSQSLLEAYSAGRFDAVIGRTEDIAGDGEELFVDNLAWVAARGFKWLPSDPLPLVTLTPPCSIREIALNTLAVHGVPWRAAFTATGVAAIQAAVTAGFGVACLEKHNIPPGCTLVPSKARLPALPTSRTVIRSRAGGRRNTEVVQAIVAAMKGAVSPAARRPPLVATM